MNSNLLLSYIFIYVRDLVSARAFYEETLGLRVLEEDEICAKYDTGDCILALNRASDFGITLDDFKDNTSLVVFHVDGINDIRANLEAKGVTFTGPTERYDIGATADFFTPDGQCFTLYEPSSEAMTWPSASKIQKILSGGIENSGVSTQTLQDKKVIYLFLFVRDVDESKEFYAKTLGLRILEEESSAGVIKYDTGGIILSTHLASEKKKEKLKRQHRIAPVLMVTNIDAAANSLASNGLKFITSPKNAGSIGKVAKFEDPNGHMFYLYQPSTQALDLPSGKRLSEICTKYH